MTPPKPSLKEQIEALAAMFDDTAQFEPRMNASLRAIASELGEIEKEIEMLRQLGACRCSCGNPSGNADTVDFCCDCGGYRP